ncbi:translation initiation factor eIF3 subunit [Coelomomyces lativittatus]|nr:translation initiation factor eIF3 subunit [Coelomomyces lativittatus]KAJ1514760.1 translation initiation factor eIF3 subunit [Coelomomyces lativittatus]KAJ1516317.1 translation initiation factor eIF3 subunit [Coelomomyces lativittatus]
MRVNVLNAHTRPVTRLKYNQDGDLLLSGGKDNLIHVFQTSTGRLLGSFLGHTGVVMDLDIHRNSTYCISASFDYTCRLWNMNTGEEVYQWTFQSPVKSVAFHPFGQMAMAVADKKVHGLCTVYIVHVPSSMDHLDLLHTQPEPLSVFLPDDDFGPATIARWGPNDRVYIGHDAGNVSYYEALSGRFLGMQPIHKSYVTDLQFSKDLSYFVTSSRDCTACIVSLELKIIKTYTIETPMNSVALCPKKPLVIVGGGKDASKVATMAGSGKFQSRFFHKILNQEVGRIKGHNGPINTIAVHPDELSFASGSEDSTIHLHHFDQAYYDFKLDARDP